MTSDTITEPNGMQRRGFLKCMTWAGTAMVWTVAGGIPWSCVSRKRVGASSRGAAVSE